jgi:hypothetical protein
MNGKGPSMLVLFEAERRRSMPDGDMRARVLSRVASTVGLPDPEPRPTSQSHVGSRGDDAPETPGATHRLPAGRGLRSSLAGWLLGRGGMGVLGLLVGGAIGAVVHAALAHPETQVLTVLAPVLIAAPAVAPPPVAPEPSSSADAASPIVAQAPVAPRTAAVPRNDASRDADLAAERGLLEMARTALARGQAEDALQALERHAASFPRGRLAEEREVLAIQSLVALGRPADAKARASRFRHLFPTSILQPAVDAALETIP